MRCLEGGLLIVLSFVTFAEGFSHVCFTRQVGISLLPGSRDACRGVRKDRVCLILSSKFPGTVSGACGLSFRSLNTKLKGASSDPMVVRKSSAARVQTSTWLAWWAQTILSVVSAITLFFANGVRGTSHTNIFANGLFLAGIGLSLSFINIIWTWAYGRIANSLAEGKPADGDKGARNLQKTLYVGVIIALAGMLITLIGAEQIVGTLVAKAITGALIPVQGTALASTSAMQLQALDIFIVQANTNTLLSHLASLLNSLYICTLSWPALGASTGSNGS